MASLAIVLVSLLVSLQLELELAAASSTWQNSVCEHLPPFLYVCPNGTKARDTNTEPPHPVPPSTNDTATGVSSKDILIDPLTNVSARLYLPTLSNVPDTKIPILVYFHGGAFIIGAPWFPLDHLYLNKVSNVASALIISVAYRMFPEHEMPVPYDDAWKALRWLAQAKFSGSEPWVSAHGDYDRVFVGGDSAGATIAHNLSVRAAKEELPYGVRIKGAFLAMPYFLGSVLLPLEPRDLRKQSFYRVWDYLCPLCVGGVDHPYINPFGTPGRLRPLPRLGIDKLMVYTAEKDYLRERGILYGDLVSLSGWNGEVQVFDTPGEGHVFHILTPQSPNTKILIDRLANFMHNQV
ncbi:hypothetical protein Dimus_000030 [Dionaea muscipula]